MKDLTLQGEPIELDNYKSNILSVAIGESRIYYKDNRSVKGELDKPKHFYRDKCNRWEDIIKNNFSPQNNNRGVPLPYFIINNTSITDESETRDAQIVYI